MEIIRSFGFTIDNILSPAPAAPGGTCCPPALQRAAGPGLGPGPATGGGYPRWYDSGLPLSSFQRGCPYGSGYSVCHCGSYAGYGSWSYALPDSGATAGPADGDLGGGKQRRRWRTVFTRSQTEQLERVFGRADYPSPQEREELARRLGLSEEAVRVWFKNRRARKKRQGHSQKPSGEPAGAASAQSPPGPPGLRSDKENHPGLSQT